MDFSGLPGIQQLNSYRVGLSNGSHSDDNSTVKKIGCWLQHKVITVICLPANLAGIGITAAAAALSACTLGAFKVAVFAGTAGNVKLHFSTGCAYLLECAVHSSWHEVRNIGELVYDYADLNYQLYLGVKWVGRALHLDAVVKAVAQLFERLFEFIAGRFDKGFAKAKASEIAIRSNHTTPWPLYYLNDLTKACRIDWSSSCRPAGMIAKHYALSILNIPLNATGAAVSFIASAVFTSFFIGKAVLYALTNINLPVPSFCGPSILYTFEMARNAVLDIGTDAADSFVLIYKATHIIGLTKIVATALDVLKYIPEAVFAR